MLNSSAQSTVIPRTVLVVEDEPTLATAIAQRITAEGWTARVASDGASAVQAASTLSSGSGHHGYHAARDGWS